MMFIVSSREGQTQVALGKQQVEPGQLYRFTITGKS